MRDAQETGISRKVAITNRQHILWINVSSCATKRSELLRMNSRKISTRSEKNEHASGPSETHIMFTGQKVAAITSSGYQQIQVVENQYSPNRSLIMNLRRQALYQFATSSSRIMVNRTAWPPRSVLSFISYSYSSQR